MGDHPTGQPLPTISRLLASTLFLDAVTIPGFSIEPGFF
jgi:hypothetical protein